VSAPSLPRPADEPGRPLLLVEDDLVERRAVARALGQRRSAEMRIARDGVEALDILRGDERAERPWVILLDLNLPRMGGLELLAELRRDPALASAVVVVLSTSTREEDRSAAAAFGVAGYVVKSELDAGLGQVLDRLAARRDRPDGP
jgi:CheY-like chemotaxis protein